MYMEMLILLSLYVLPHKGIFKLDILFDHMILFSLVK